VKKEEASPFLFLAGAGPEDRRVSPSFLFLAPAGENPNGVSQCTRSLMRDAIGVGSCIMRTTITIDDAVLEQLKIRGLGSGLRRAIFTRSRSWPRSLGCHRRAETGSLHASHQRAYSVG
jgi:hypothetical protein